MIAVGLLLGFVPSFWRLSDPYGDLKHIAYTFAVVCGVFGAIGLLPPSARGKPLLPPAVGDGAGALLGFLLLLGSAVFTQPKASSLWAAFLLTGAPLFGLSIGRLARSRAVGLAAGATAGALFLSLGPWLGKVLAQLLLHQPPS
jgi:hypothetical protein